MNEKDFINKMSKYPKEIILKAIFENFFFSTKEIVKAIKITDVKFRFNKLMNKSNEIVDKMELLVDRTDYKSSKRYIKFMLEDIKIQKKAESVMKEIDKI